MNELEKDRGAWIDKRVVDARLASSGNSSERFLLSIIDEFAELLRVHFVGVDE